MIQPNGRIEQIDGMHFYEQDIVMLEYIYENSIKAIINLDYRYPGFGVVLATPANNQSAAFTNFAYLFRVGDGEWTIDSLWLDKQKRVAQGTTPLYSDYKKQNNFVLTFKYDKVQDLAEWYMDVVDKQTGVSNTVRIMSYQMKEKIEEFRVGFYSNKNNTIKGASIYDERPQFWFTNIKNSNGGRISFKRNQIMFENTDEDLEVEEQLIPLKKGTYYFNYAAELAENGHVEAYVIPSEYKMLQIDPSKKDLIKHNIVKDNNVIEIEEDMEVNVCKEKHLTNTRASGSDDALRLVPPRIFSLEQAIEYIGEDELVEVTPKNIRLRKKILDPTARIRWMRANGLL